MKKLDINLYKDAIASYGLPTDNIRTPKIPGNTNPVFIVNALSQSFIFKFGDRNMIMKNNTVSKIFETASIPAPKTFMHKYNEQYSEVYTYSPNKTLFERINENMPYDKVKDVFQDALKYMHKMSELDEYCLDSHEHKYYYKVAGSNVAQNSGRIHSGFIQTLVYLLTIGKKRLYHCDATPKNILVTPDDKFHSFIDLDSVALSNDTFALSAMFTKYAQQGYDISELMDYFENLAKRKIRRRRIHFQANLITSARNLHRKYLNWRACH
ncbi:MAG: hypothetical protein FWG18_03895 [Alphaproteobacteria bacterium]|nr:hypothetical protein [Alphaproteobacteria bacterium]